MRAEKIKLQAHITTIENEKADLLKRIDETNAKVDLTKDQSIEKVKRIET